MECWLELIGEGGGRVRFAGHNVFRATGEVVVARSELRFRSRAEITGHLVDGGFTIERLYGDWQQGPLTSGSSVMVFVASRS